MTDLKRGLGEAVSAAFASAGLSAELGRVTPSDRPDLADFQCNGALAAAKQARRDPREIAAGVVAELAKDPRLASVEIAGLGFINMRVAPEALSARANEIAADPRLGAGAAAAVSVSSAGFIQPAMCWPMSLPVDSSTNTLASALARPSGPKNSVDPMTLGAAARVSPVASRQWRRQSET